MWNCWSQHGAEQHAEHPFTGNLEYQDWHLPNHGVYTVAPEWVLSGTALGLNIASEKAAASRQRLS